MPRPKKQPDNFIVIYRTGGWANAVWHETSITKPGDETQTRRDEIERQGYKTMTKPVRELRSIGLPIGFCAHADPITGKMKEKRCKCN